MKIRAVLEFGDFKSKEQAEYFMKETAKVFETSYTIHVVSQHIWSEDDTAR